MKKINTQEHNSACCEKLRLPAAILCVFNRNLMALLELGEVLKLIRLLESFGTKRKNKNKTAVYVQGTYKQIMHK